MKYSANQSVAQQVLENIRGPFAVEGIDPDGEAYLLIAENTIFTMYYKNNRNTLIYFDQGDALFSEEVIPEKGLGNIARIVRADKLVLEDLTQVAHFNFKVFLGSFGNFFKHKPVTKVIQTVLDRSGFS